MPRILYLHGLGSSAESETAQALAKSPHKVMTVSYRPHRFLESMEYLGNLIEANNIEVVIGTSMGGFYALKLAERYALQVVAINPAIDPRKSLARKLETGITLYFTGEIVPFTADQLAEFEPVLPDKLAMKTASIKFLIGERDDVVDPIELRKNCLANGWNFELLPWGHRIEDPAYVLNVADYLYSLVPG